MAHVPVQMVDWKWWHFTGFGDDKRRQRASPARDNNERQKKKTWMCHQSKRLIVASCVICAYFRHLRGHLVSIYNFFFSWNSKVEWRWFHFLFANSWYNKKRSVIRYFIIIFIACALLCLRTEAKPKSPMYSSSLIDVQYLSVWMCLLRCQMNVLACGAAWVCEWFKFFIKRQEFIRCEIYAKQQVDYV